MTRSRVATTKVTTAQREKHVREAKKKADERREQASGGASGFVADRAGDWSVHDFDPGFVEFQK